MIELNDIQVEFDGQFINVQVNPEVNKLFGLKFVQLYPKAMQQ